jgi:hypothetical protein
MRKRAAVRILRAMLADGQPHSGTAAAHYLAAGAPEAAPVAECSELAAGALAELEAQGAAARDGQGRWVQTREGGPGRKLGRKAQRTGPIPVRVTPELVAGWKAEARAAGVTLAHWVRETLENRRAERLRRLRGLGLADEIRELEALRDDG